MPLEPFDRCRQVALTNSPSYILTLFAPNLRENVEVCSMTVPCCAKSGILRNVLNDADMDFTL